MNSKNPFSRQQVFGSKISRLALAVLVSLCTPLLHAQEADTDNDGFDDITEGIYNNNTVEVVVNNAGFEDTGDVIIAAEDYSNIDAAEVPYWSTTATDNIIEIWQTGFRGVESYEGDQHAELNATQLSTLFQDIDTIPGTSLNWSVAHRGRSGTDTATFSVGPPEGPYNIVEVMVSPVGFWSEYSGSVVIPEGQTTTRVRFEAIDGSTGGDGNFIDGFVLQTVSRDSDADGVPDYLDIESDGDGLSDSFEGALDSDDDGVLDRIDLDSDNDGILDVIEAAIADLEDASTFDLPVDTDEDGIFDYLDADSDNDGLSDSLEALEASSDADRDGIIDDFTDVNRDGLDDTITLLSDAIDNIDEDDLIDPLDLDTDNDTFLDIVEGGIIAIGGVDDDGDGMLDSMQDLDGDSVPNAVDVDYVGGTDADLDSIVDSADVDSTGSSDTDGDGIDDAGDPDANADGMADLVRDFGFYALPDEDEEGTPDVEQAFSSDGTDTSNSSDGTDTTDSSNETVTTDVETVAASEARYQTSLQGGGCSIATGNGSSDFSLLTLLAFATFGIAFSRRRLAARGATGKCVPVAVLAISGGLISLLSPVDKAVGQSSYESTQSSSERSMSDALFGRRYYVGIGSGQSWLEPDTSEVDGVDPSERNDVGTQLSVGMDYSPLVSFELHAASLGEAELSSGEVIEYNHVGLSSLIYFGGARNRFNRQGFTAYGRVGFGSILNHADDSVPYEKDSEVQVTLGLGAEFATSFGLAVRAETMVFDADANYSQLGVIYRFGPAPEWPTDYVAPKAIHRDEPAQQVVQERAPRPAPIATPTPTPNENPDQDNDGIMNQSDACENTLPGLAVDKLGCVIFNGVLEGVNFLPGSAELTAQSRSRLNEVVQILLNQATMKIELSAYTDNVGSEADNDALSAQRVKAVAIYMINQGVNKSRFSLRAFGERSPIASHDTGQGRAANRRVEIKGIS